MLRFGILLFLSFSAWPAGQRWTADDLWEQHTPFDPQISPDGQQVVYLESWNDRSANAACSNLWLVTIRNPQPRRLTSGAWQDRSPRWSPDGARLAWISGRGAIHLMTLSSGEQTVIDASALSLAWSPDGRSIAFTTSLPVPAPVPAWAPAAILPWLWPRPASRTSLRLVPATGGNPETISAPDFDALGEPAWMPDGKSLLIASSDGEIYSFRRADRTARRAIPESGRKEHPLPAPDGSKIAWLSYDAKPASYSVRKLFVMNADGSRVKPLAGALDRDPSNPHWSSDSRTIYFTADESGSTHIYASRADSTLRQVTKGVERLEGFSLADNGHAVTVRSTDRTVEVVSFAVDLPPHPVVLAAPMEKQFAAHEMATVEEIQFPSGAKTIQSWLVRPAGFDASRQYPLLLDIADSPRRMFGPEFSLRAQIFAARGWMVLQVNPRGTPGFGEQFGRILPSDYPGDDAADLLASVDYIVAKGGVDPKRLAISGGLLAAWIVGHTDRFTSVIARHAIVNLLLDADNLPWMDTAQMGSHSPLAFAAQWKTPMLVLASAVDPQSDELVAILRQRGVEWWMVRLPDDSPSTQVLEWETMLAWLR